MNIKSILGSAMLLLLFSATSAYSATAEFQIQSYVGTVRVSPDIGKTWKNAKVDMSLNKKDLLHAGKNSSCYVEMPKKGLFYITENSYVYISTLTTTKTALQIPLGKIFYKLTEKVKTGGYFTIATSVAVATVRGTEFAMESTGDTVKIEVANGEVTVRRNIKIPDFDKLDTETKSLLEISVKKDREILLTLDENKQLENLLNRAKGNLLEYKRILREDNAAMKKKVVLQKRAKELFKMMDEYEKSRGNEDEEMNEFMKKFQDRSQKK